MSRTTKRTGAPGLTAALDMKGAIARAEAVEAATAAADAALLASGEELLTLRALAKELAVAERDLLAIVAPIAEVRYLTSAVPYRYSAKDVREAVQPHLERLQASLAGEQAVQARRRRGACVVTEEKPYTGPVDPAQVAERLVALSGMGRTALARALAVSIHTLDRMVCDRAATDATYRRMLPWLGQLEEQVAALTVRGAASSATRKGAR